ncbi:MAG: GNAT family N-acetyltransferase, partial [Methylococcaceae bacterium]
AQVRAGRQLFAQHRMPTFINPESAVAALGFLNEYHRNQQMLLQVPAPLTLETPPDIKGARLIIEGALSEHRAWLSALEARALLHAFRIPVIPALPARSANEALSAAECLGFPVALKISSPDITHKSEVDGVWLHIDQAEHVRHAYTELLNRVKTLNPTARLDGVTVEKMYEGRYGRELMLGILQDFTFGPVISFGAGGTAVEIFNDRAVALPPLNEHIATTLIRQTRAARWLEAWRHVPPINQAALIQTLLRLSTLACELPEITELDINPLMADETGVIALDVRIAVRQTPLSRLRYGHMAIHPYPGHLISTFETPEGLKITIRPIRPEDADREQTFVRGLSGEARFFRFMDTLQELSHDMLIRLTQPDYNRELALIATVMTDDEEQQIGVARYFTNPDGHSAEFALVIADAWQGKGLGSRLMTSLIEAAREKGFRYLEGEVLTRNTRMLKLMHRLGFNTQIHSDDPSLYRVMREL